MNNHDTTVIILAGGLGKRMNSELPKVLHKLINKPMLIYVIETALKLSPKKICIVVGKYYNIILENIKLYINDSIINEKIVFINQPLPLGTGNAIQCCKEYLLSNININYNNDTINSLNKVLILSGDVPLINHKTLHNLLNTNFSINILVANLENPNGYGRVIIQDNKFIKIIEDKDCNLDEKKITLINAGIYMFDTELLCKYIDKLDNNNSQNEYYLTQIIEKFTHQLNDNKININYEIVNDPLEIMGINNIEQLKTLESNIGFLQY